MVHFEFSGGAVKNSLQLMKKERKKEKTQAQSQRLNKNFRNRQHHSKLDYMAKKVAKN